MQLKRKVWVCLAILLLACNSTGCTNYYSPYYYEGAYPDLFTVAINSLLGAKGYYQHEIHEEPQIMILETDAYDRILFAYSEDSTISTLSLLIMQYKDEDYAYFYADENFISCAAEYDYLDYEAFEESLQDAFTEEEIHALKVNNDWGKALNPAQCTKAKIERRKNIPDTSVTEKDLDALCKAYVREYKGYKGNDEIYRFDTYCTSDMYGRKLYYVYGIGRDVNGEGVSPNSKHMYIDFAVIIQADDTYDKDVCIMEIPNKYAYQDQLKVFKKANGWNQQIV